MSIFCDKTIAGYGPAMFNPFVGQLTGGISYGLSSAGYDVSLSQEDFRHAKYIGGVLDPKGGAAEIARFFEPVELEFDQRGQFFVMDPLGFALGCTAETVTVPANCLGFVYNKSTYARVGQFQPATVLEPEWSGQITLEFFNCLPVPVRIYAGEGIAQIVMVEINERPARTYADREGKYQGQAGVVLANGGR